MKQNKVNNDTKYCMEQKILLKYSLKLARKQKNIHNKFLFLKLNYWIKLSPSKQPVMKPEAPL